MATIRSSVEHPLPSICLESCQFTPVPSQLIIASAANAGVDLHKKGLREAIRRDD